MNKQQLEAALEAANIKITELEAALVEAGRASEVKDKHILELDKEMQRLLEVKLAKAKAAQGEVAEKLSDDEYDIRSRQRAGLTREQAEAAHEAQKEHDARLAAAQSAP